MASPSLPSTYKSVHLAIRPTDGITPSTFVTKTHTTPSTSSLTATQVLFKPHYLSLDPAMRGWLADVRSYIPPVQIDEVMRGMCVGLVLAVGGKVKKVRSGEWAVVTCGWTEMAVVEEGEVEVFQVGKGKGEGIVPTDALGVLGLTGLTAYFGITDVGQVKAGDFVVVSGAAGATGSVVGQIAKLKGAKVLGIAGADDKVKWLKEELGFDEALNYKDPEFQQKFKVATKDLIDVFFDNVGGDILEMALGRAKEHSRFVICGGISQYNTSNPQGPRNYLMIVKMRIRMQGFIVFDYAEQYPKARKELARWLEEGKIKRKETIIKGGLDKAADGLVELYKGVNTGKLLVEIAPYEGDLKSNL